MIISYCKYHSTFTIGFNEHSKLKMNIYATLQEFDKDKELYMLIKLLKIVFRASYSLVLLFSKTHFNSFFPNVLKYFDNVINLNNVHYFSMQYSNFTSVFLSLER